MCLNITRGKCIRCSAYWSLNPALILLSARLPMWANLIVVYAQILPLFSGIGKGQEPVGVQALALEPVVAGVVGRFSGA